MIPFRWRAEWPDRRGRTDRGLARAEKYAGKLKLVGNGDLFKKTTTWPNKTHGSGVAGR